METHLRYAKRLIRLLDAQYSIFGVKVGIDPLLDIWPGLGGLISAGISFYLLWIAYELNVPTWVYLRMLWNITVDYALGNVPVVGFVFDIFYRSNVKNFSLLEKYIGPIIMKRINED